MIVYKSIGCVLTLSLCGLIACADVATAPLVELKQEEIAAEPKTNVACENVVQETCKRLGHEDNGDCYMRLVQLCLDTAEVCMQKCEEILDPKLEPGCRAFCAQGL